MTLKKFKVIRILNTDYIIIDGGKNQGVTKGDPVKIYSPNFFREIKDLNGKVLDRIPTPKADYLEVVNVYNNSAICAGIMEKNPIYSNLAANGLYNTFKASIGRKELKVKLKKARDLELDDSPIDIGDIAEVEINIASPSTVLNHNK